MKRLVWMGCLSYFLIGLAHAVLGSVLPVLLHHYGKEYSEGGALIFAQFAGFLLGVVGSSKLSRLFSKRSTLLLSIFLLSAAELLYAALPPWGWLFLIAPVAGFGFGAIEAVIGTIVISAIKDRSSIVMSRLGVLFCAGAMIMPLTASLLISVGYWRYSFVLITLCAAISFILWKTSRFGEFGSVLDAKTKKRPDGTGEGTSSFIYRGKNLTALLLFIVFFFTYVGTETSLANFMPAILIKKLDINEATAALSVSCFWIAMSFARLFAGYIAERLQYGLYLLISCSATVLMILLLPSADRVWSSFGVVLVLGLAMSGIFSITLVFASKLISGSEETTPSIMIASGGVGGAVLPLLTGWSLDHMKLSQSVLLLAGFSFALLVMIAVAYKWQRAAAYLKKDVSLGEGT